MTPLENAAVAYVRAMRRAEPGGITQAWLHLAEKADLAEKKAPTSASSLPDARTVAAAALPKPEEVGDRSAGLAAARAAFQRSSGRTSTDG